MLLFPLLLSTLNTDYRSGEVLKSYFKVSNLSFSNSFFNSCNTLEGTILDTGKSPRIVLGNVEASVVWLVRGMYVSITFWRNLDVDRVGLL